MYQRVFFGISPCFKESIRGVDIFLYQNAVAIVVGKPINHGYAYFFNLECYGMAFALFNPRQEK